ncbi:MAG: DMT family transporter [Alphaproteobacteria bacterium]|nr:DMT family transporter [Alphaproteobacteria bacterium]
MNDTKSTFLNFFEQKTISILVLILASFFLSTSAILGRFSEVDPIILLFMRLIFASTFLSVYFPNSFITQTKTRPRSTIFWILFTGFNFTASLFCWYTAFNYTSHANVIFLGNLSPIIVVFLAYFFLKEHLDISAWFGLLFATFGIYLLFYDNFDLSADLWIGDLISLGCSVFYALYFIGIRQLSNKMSSNQSIPLITFSATLFALPLFIISDVSLWTISLNNWIGVILTAFLVQLMGQGLNSFSMSRLPGYYCLIPCLLSPSFALLWIYLFYDEPINAAQLEGGIFIFISLSLILIKLPVRLRQKSI